MSYELRNCEYCNPTLIKIGGGDFLCRGVISGTSDRSGVTKRSCCRQHSCAAILKRCTGIIMQPPRLTGGIVTPGSVVVTCVKTASVCSTLFWPDIRVATQLTLGACDLTCHAIQRGSGRFCWRSTYNLCFHTKLWKYRDWPDLFMSYVRFYHDLVEHSRRRMVKPHITHKKTWSIPILT